MTDMLVAILIVMMIFQLSGIAQRMNIARMIEAAGAAAMLGLGIGTINIRTQSADRCELQIQ